MSASWTNDDVVVEALAQAPAASARRSRSSADARIDVLVDLGLELELELRRLAAQRGAIGEIHEVAHALDDLAERIEAGAVDVDGALAEARDAEQQLEAVFRLAHEERFALALVRRA